MSRHRPQFYTTAPSRWRAPTPLLPRRARRAVRPPPLCREDVAHPPDPRLRFDFSSGSPGTEPRLRKNGKGTPRQEVALSPLCCGPGLKRGRASSSPSVSRKNFSRAGRARQTFGPISRSGPVTMPPMLRRLLTVLSIVSLLLCVATLVLWVRSYWVSDALLEVHYLPLDPSLSMHDGVPPRATQRVRGINAIRGGLLVFQTYRAVGADMVGVISGRHWLRQASSTAPSTPSRFRFTFERKRSQYGRYIRLQFPFWGIALACAILPASWLLSARRRWRRESRERNGQCVNCGYDLRATSDRCPECGKTAQRSVTV
jgi:hypothetical protein